MAKQIKEFLPDTIIWYKARQSSLPPWPCKVIKCSKRGFNVEFLGDHANVELEAVPKFGIYEFRCANFKKFVAEGQRSNHTDAKAYFGMALDEALRLEKNQNLALPTDKKKNLALEVTDRSKREDTTRKPKNKRKKMTAAESSPKKVKSSRKGKVVSIPKATEYPSSLESEEEDDDDLVAYSPTCSQDLPYDANDVVWCSYEGLWIPAKIIKRKRRKFEVMPYLEDVDRFTVSADECRKWNLSNWPDKKKVNLESLKKKGSKEHDDFTEAVQAAQKDIRLRAVSDDPPTPMTSRIVTKTTEITTVVTTKEETREIVPVSDNQRRQSDLARVKQSLNFDEEEEELEQREREKRTKILQELKRKYIKMKLSDALETIDESLRGVIDGTEPSALRDELDAGKRFPERTHEIAASGPFSDKQRLKIQNLLKKKYKKLLEKKRSMFLDQVLVPEALILLIASTEGMDHEKANRLRHEDFRSEEQRRADHFSILKI